MNTDKSKPQPAPPSSTNAPSGAAHSKGAGPETEAGPDKGAGPAGPSKPQKAGAAATGGKTWWQRLWSGSAATAKPVRAGGDATAKAQGAAKGAAGGPGSGLNAQGNPTAAAGVQTPGAPGSKPSAGAPLPAGHTVPHVLPGGLSKPGSGPEPAKAPELKGGAPEPAPVSAPKPSTAPSGEGPAQGGIDKAADAKAPSSSATAGASDKAGSPESKAGGDGTSSGEGKPARKRWKRRSLGIGWIFAVAVLGGALFAAAFYWLRFEQKPKSVHRIVGTVFLPGYEMPDETVSIVRDFQEDIHAIQRGHQKQRAWQPVVNEYPQRSREVEAAREKVATARARVEEIEAPRAGLQSQMMERSTTRARELAKAWQDSAAALQAEYVDRESAIKSTLRSRAQAKGIAIQENPLVDAPDVLVSGYRLGVYKWGQGASNRTDELRWADQRLEEWKTFRQDWETRRDEMRAQMESSQSEPDMQLEAMRAELEESAEELEVRRKELAEAEALLEEAEEVLATTPNIQTEELDPVDWAAELAKVPETKRLATTRPQDGQFAFEPLDPAWSDGKGGYVVFFRALKAGLEYWGIVRLKVPEGEERRVRLTPDQLQSVVTLLESEPPPLPEAPLTNAVAQAGSGTGSGLGEAPVEASAESTAPEEMPAEAPTEAPVAAGATNDSSGALAQPDADEGTGEEVDPVAPMPEPDLIGETTEQTEPAAEPEPETGGMVQDFEVAPIPEGESSSEDDEAFNFGLGTTRESTGSDEAQE